MNNFVGKLLAICFFAFIAWSIWTTRQEMQSSHNWLEVRGRLTEAYIKEVHDRDKNGFSSDYFMVRIKYDYLVNGTWYHGDRLKINGQSFSTEAQASAQLKELQNQKILTVYYNPADPTKSTLIR